MTEAVPRVGDETEPRAADPRMLNNHSFYCGRRRKKGAKRKKIVIRERPSTGAAAVVFELGDFQCS
jgi:hypothetical protein